MGHFFDPEVSSSRVFSITILTYAGVIPLFLNTYMELFLLACFLRES